MRTIVKGAEPSSLTAHRQMQNADYDNYADKDGLRSLARDRAARHLLLLHEPDP